MLLLAILKLSTIHKDIKRRQGISKRKVLFILLFAVMTTFTPRIMAGTMYKQPEQRIIDIVDAPNPPQLSVSPQGKTAILVEYSFHLDLEDLGEPWVGLAGVRILTRYNIEKRRYFVKKMYILDMETGKKKELQMPEKSRFGFPNWTSNGKKIIAANYKIGGSELWVFDPETGSGKAITPARLNPVLMNPFYIFADSETMIVPLYPENRGKALEKDLIPEGPEIQETTGSVSKVRTYQDLLRNSYDEKLFEYYATSELAVVNLNTGESKILGKPDLYSSIRPSHDGKHFIVKRIKKPFSYTVPYSRFGYELEIWNEEGKNIKTIVSQPLAEEIPIEGVRTGTRLAFWQMQFSDRILIAEALDNGDPNKKAEYRDSIKILEAPFTGEPREIVKLPFRFYGLHWLENKNLAITMDYDRDSRWYYQRLINLDKTNVASECPVIFSRNRSDAYKDEGEPIYTEKNGYNYAILEDDKWLYLAGSGATPEGFKPFLNKFNIYTKEKIELFRSDLKALEAFEAFYDSSLKTIVTSKEDPEHPRNYFKRTLKNGKLSDPVALTHFESPAPEIAAVKKELIKYTRKDGIPLSGTLYYPQNYVPGKKYPTVLWAYPREYTDASVAGQVRSASNKYARIAGSSILFFVLNGYAVLDNAEIPVVGDPLTANDTFVEQISAGAEAAVNKLVEMGIADRKKIGVAGHSYGAFMVANLLAHTDLFAAGISRSGAYNRTLTPFGFQGERRTFWEAQDIYMKLSPFSVADKINEPLLLIHGEKDPNPGTFPLQSRRMYAAIKGHGGTARLVVLPCEGHGYEARESVLHVLYEMFEWFDKYLK